MVTASDLQTWLNDAGVQASWVSPLEEAGAFLVYLTAIKGASPLLQVEKMKQMPEMLAVEKRNTDYIYRVKVVTGSPD